MPRDRTQVRTINHWQNLIQFVDALRSTLLRGLGAPVAAGPTFAFRGTPVLRRDDQSNTPCTVCGLCGQACPTRCLGVTRKGDAISFELDERRCMFCGLCAEVCPVDAIELCATAPLWQSEERLS